ncbi:ATP-binding protein [Streptomyces sp. YGL11-2]|uniref:ATP-binding protein n=1 Tax=Streptomyces sp. YGL11-2 TaxID=3414028 RepID=UPI003CE6E57F
MSTGSGRSIPPAQEVPQALGHQAVRKSANVRFVKSSRILGEIAGSHTDRTWDMRMRELIRPDLLVLDDFAMHQRRQVKSDTARTAAKHIKSKLSRRSRD